MKSECPECRGTGWVIRQDPQPETATHCPRCRDEQAKKNRLQRAAIPPRYADRGFEVYSVHDPTQESALKKAIEYVERYPRVSRGLLFSGPCGVGKTHLAVAILRTLAEEKGVRARFVDEAELLRRLQYSYGSESSGREEEFVIPLMEAELLVWDDLGTGRPTDWVRETIRMVVNARYTSDRVTIMTTNWPLRSSTGGSDRDRGTLEERIGTRLFSRVMEMCEVVEVRGPDARTAIHKAGMDFRRESSRQGGLKIPTALIQCPQCKGKKIRSLDQTGTKKSSKGDFIDLSCLCNKCETHFLARFFVRSATFEYPPSP